MANSPASPPEDRPRRRISSIENALRILVLLSEGDGSSGVSDLSRRLGIGKSSVHDALAMLREYRFVDRDPAGRYVLGLRAFEVGAATVNQRVGPDLAPLMERLAYATSEAVSLAVMDDDAALIVQRFESSHVLRADMRLGTRMALHASASGKVMLAQLTGAELERLYPDESLPRVALATVSTKAALTDELEQIRAAGYAVNRDELVEGISAVACPVFERTGALLGALSIAGPTARFDPGQWIGALLDTAGEMSALPTDGALLAAPQPAPRTVAPHEPRVR